MVDYPLNKKKKGFTDKEKDFSNNELDSKYKKKQNVYLIYQAVLADYNNDSNSEVSGKEDKLNINYNIIY